jgi:hypothetical protein
MAMLDPDKVRRYFLEPVGLRINSTSDVDLQIVEEIFSSDDWKGAIDLNGERLALCSTEPPSFVHLFATLAWWKQLLLASGGAVATGYLNKLGASIYDNECRHFDLSSTRIWALADRLVALQSLLPERTEISVAFPSKDFSFPVLFRVRSLDADDVAWQVAILYFHADRIADFIESIEFNSIGSVGAYVQDDGSVKICWWDREATELQERLFLIN